MSTCQLLARLLAVWQATEIGVGKAWGACKELAAGVDDRLLGLLPARLFPHFVQTGDRSSQNPNAFVVSASHWTAIPKDLHAMTEALQKAEEENERLRDAVCDMASALAEIADAFAEDWESEEAMDAMEQPLP